MDNHPLQDNMRKLAFAGLVAGIVATPALAQAQMCIGIPTVGGQFAVVGSIGFPEGGKDVGGTVIADFAGPLSLAAGASVFMIDDVDENITTFGGQAAYEIPVSPQFSTCAVAGVEYASFSDEAFGIEVDISQIVVPVGIGIGYGIASDAVDLNLFAVPQLLWIRSSFEASVGGESGSETDSMTEFGAEVGATIGKGMLFGRGSYSFTSVEDDDGVFTIGVGLVLGGSR